MCEINSEMSFAKFITEYNCINCPDIGFVCERHGKSQILTANGTRVVMMNADDEPEHQQHTATCWQQESEANQVSPKWRPTRWACARTMITDGYTKPQSRYYNNFAEYTSWYRHLPASTRSFDTDSILYQIWHGSYVLLSIDNVTSRNVWNSLEWIGYRAVCENASGPTKNWIICLRITMLLLPILDRRNSLGFICLFWFNGISGCDGESLKFWRKKNMIGHGIVRFVRVEYRLCRLTFTYMRQSSIFFRLNFLTMDVPWIYFGQHHQKCSEWRTYVW